MGVIQTLRQAILPPPSAPPPPVKRYDAIFICASRNQADIWAREWGYDPRRVAFITNREQSRGWADPGIPVYVCGSNRPDGWEDIIAPFMAYGVEIIDAQDITQPNSF